MSMGPRRMGQVVAAACAAITAGLSLPSCGNDSPQCISSNNPEGGFSDDGGDTGAGFLTVVGTIGGTVCPTVNPISVGPDNGGYVVLGATINNDADASGFLFTWSASSGSFSDPSALDTTYACTSMGTVAVALTITGSGCDQQSGAMIDCTTAVGAN